MRQGLTLIAAPPVEPISLAQAKLHLEIDADITKYDDLVEDELIPSARQWCERFTGRSLIDQTWELAFDSGYQWDGRTPFGIALPKPPFLALVSYVYTDVNGSEQTLAADQYVVDDSVEAEPLLLPAYNVSWPAVRTGPGALKVRYRAGYVDRTGSPTQDVALVPAPLRSAMKVVIGMLFEDREKGEVPAAALNLARPYRVEGLGG